MKLPDYLTSRIWTKKYPPGVPADVEIPNVPYQSYFDEAVRRFPDNVAIKFLRTAIDYKTLRDHVVRFAAGLHQLGVRKGDRVSIYLLNSPQFVVAYFATLSLGAVASPLNPLYTAREVEFQLRDSGARVVICLDLFLKTLADVRTHTAVSTAVVTNVADYLPGFKRALGKLLKKIPTAAVPRENWIHNYRTLLGGSPASVPPVELDPRSDLAALPYTGGTTGVPKGVMLTHRNLVSQIVQGRAFFGEFFEEGRERVLALLPFFHIYGQTITMGLFGLASGNTMIVFPRPDLDAVVKAILSERLSIFLAVPSLYNYIVNLPQAKRLDFSSLKLCICGADRLHEEIAKRFEALTGRPICEGYGLTETSPATHANPPTGVRVGSMGLPGPNTNAAILSEDGTQFLPPGEVGEVVISGPQVMTGYWNSPEETANVLITLDGTRWFRTGDFARVDDEGYFFFVERRKDMIKYKGWPVFPAEVEGVLYQHPAVKEAGVIGMSDPAVGERIHAVIVLRDEFQGKVTADELLAWCRERLASYKLPQRIEFARELPKSLIGKVLRRKLREEVLARTAN